MITIQDALSDEHLKQFLDTYNISCKVFDVLRIVDPVQKEVCSYEENRILTTPTKCYSAWTKNRICDNCISIRAYTTQQEVMKFEYDHEVVHLIIAIPFTYQDQHYVFELLKNVTDSWIAPHLQTNKEVLLTELIERLNFIASKDELTKVYKKSYIDERLSSDFHLAKETGKLSLAMLDLDHFKYVNDTFGHLAGDYLLEQLGQIILEHIDLHQCWAARFGGDEFTLVFNNLTREEVYEKLHRIREQVASTQFNFEGRLFNVTISIGITHYKSFLQNFNELINIADKNLYVSKKIGGNTVID